MRCFLLLVSLSFLPGCGGSGGISSGKQAQAKSDSNSNGEIPSPTTGTGTLVIAIEDDSNVDADSVSGYVVGHQDLKLEKSGENYYINNVPAGKTDVIVTGNLVIKSNLTADGKLGIRKNNIEVTADTKADVEVDKLPKVGSISGTVKRKGKTDNAGIDVYVPGTGYIAKTASDGAFEILDVPVGMHEVYFDSDGYGRGVISAVEVKTDAATEVEPIKLVVKSGPSAKLLLADGAEIVDSLTIEVVLIPSDDAVLYMLSDDQAFKNVSWQPLITQTTYSFKDGGTKTLYARFADANGLESTPISASIKVDVDGPEGSVAVKGGIKFTNSRATSLEIKASDDFSDVEEMQISLSSSFNGASWQDYATSGSITLSDTPGLQTIYVRFKDSFNHISSSVSTTITYDPSAPSVHSVTPAASSAGIAIGSHISVVFSEIIDDSSVTTDSIQLLLGSTPMDISVSTADDTVTITPSAHMDPYSQYTVSISSDIKDRAGNALAADVSSSFTTAHGWADQVALTTSASDVGSAKLTATGSGKILAAWWMPSNSIYTTYSSDQRTFATPQALTTTNGGATAPTLILDNCAYGRAVLGYSGGGAIYIAKYNGTSWGTPVDVSPGAATLMGLACSKYEHGNNDIEAWMLFNYGGAVKACSITGSLSSSTCSSATSLDSTGTAYSVSIAMDALGHSMATWYHYYDDSDNNYDGNRVFYSFYNGSSWSSSALIDNPANTNTENPTVAFDSVGNANVLWRQGANSCPNTGSIIKSRLFNTSGSGGGVLTVDSDNSDCSRDPTVAMLSDNFYAAWGAGMASQVPAVNKTASGNWGSNTLLRDEYNLFATPSIKAGGSIVALAWVETSSSSSLWYAINNGTSWGSATQLLDTVSSAIIPALHVGSDDTIYILSGQGDGPRQLMLNRYR